MTTDNQKTDECREAFEQWRTGGDYEPEKYDNGDYVDDRTHYAWCAYQNAWNRRATPQTTPPGEVVALPVVFNRRWSLARDGFGLDRDDANGNYVHIDDAVHLLSTEIAKRDAEIAKRDEIVGGLDSHTLDLLQTIHDQDAELTTLRAQLAEAQKGAQPLSQSIRDRLDAASVQEG